MEWITFLFGTLAGIVIVAALIVALILYLFKDLRKQIGKVLLKHYSPWSLFAILVISILELTDLTQSVLGLSLALVGLIVVILLQIFVAKNSLVKAIVLGAIAGLVIAVPTAILGLVMSALGLAGSISKSHKKKG